MNKMRDFTHGADGQDWSKQYQYHAIAYRFGKRVMLEYPDPRDLLEDAKYGECASISLVITPNGKCFKRDEWIEAYEIALGLIVPEPPERNATAEYMRLNPPPSPARDM